MENMTLLVSSLQQTLKDLGVKLSRPSLRLLAWLTALLLEGNKAQLHELADGLPDHRDPLTKRQRVRRFLSQKLLRPRFFLRPLLRLLSPLLLSLETLELSLDRTDWEKRGKPVNILTVALVYKGRALPLFWLCLGYKGASSFLLWQQALEPVLTALESIPELAAKPVQVLADREFASPKLAHWLARQGAGFTLRLKRSEYLNLEEEVSLKLASWADRCQPGQWFFFRAVTVTRDCDFPVNVLIAWPEGEEEPILLMSDLTDHRTLLDSYAHRFGIEPMFKDTKSNAFDLEQGRMTDPLRLEALLIPVALAYALAVLEGDALEQQGCTPKPPKGKVRAVGLFLVGLRAWMWGIRRKSGYLFRRWLRAFFGRILNWEDLTRQEVRAIQGQKC